MSVPAQREFARLVEDFAVLMTSTDDPIQTLSLFLVALAATVGEINGVAEDTTTRLILTAAPSSSENFVA